MCKAVPIKDFPGYYITDSGLVYSRKTYKNRDGRIRRIKTVQRKTGYINIGLNRDNKQFVIPLHRLVANAFIPNPDNKPQVNHINGIKSDNRAENLEWVTPSENIKHSYNTLGKKRNPHFNVYRKWVVRIKDGIIIDKFHGTREASRQTGIRQARISDCCRGLIKHAGGFQWKYIDGDWKDSLMKCGGNSIKWNSKDVMPHPKDTHHIITKSGFEYQWLPTRDWKNPKNNGWYSYETDKMFVDCPEDWMDYEVWKRSLFMKCGEKK